MIDDDSTRLESTRTRLTRRLDSTLLPRTKMQFYKRQLLVEKERANEGESDTPGSQDTEITRPIHVSATSNELEKVNEDVSASVGQEEEEESDGENVSASNHKGISKSSSASAKSSNGATDKYVLRGPHVGKNKTKGVGGKVENGRNEGSHSFSPDAAKGRTQKSSVDTQHEDAPHVRHSPSSQTQTMQTVRKVCGLFQIRCHAKQTFSNHPMTSVLVVGICAVLLIRRIVRKSWNNEHNRMDGRGEYRQINIELLEGNFDDSLSFTGENEDYDDWREPLGNEFPDEIADDSKLTLRELNG